MMVNVRPGVLADLETLVAFTRAEALEAEGLTLPEENVRVGVRAGLLDPSLARYWLIEDQEEAVGSISVVREWSDWQGGYYWWIQSLYIQPLYRGRGLLHLMLAAIVAEAREEGALSLRLYAHGENIRAIRAYRREGFIDTAYRVLAIDLS